MENGRKGEMAPPHYTGNDYVVVLHTCVCVFFEYTASSTVRVNGGGGGRGTRYGETRELPRRGSFFTTLCSSIHHARQEEKGPGNPGRA